MAIKKTSNEFKIDGWTVNPRSGSITGQEASTRIGPNVMEVLLFLVRHRGGIVSREQIFSAVWPGIAVSDDVLTQAITSLRKAFGDSSRNPKIIRTLPKRGYSLIAEVQETKPSQLHSPARITCFTLEGGAKRDPGISPDGNRVAYVWSGESRSSWDIYVKPIGTGTETSRLTDNPSEDRSPVWSPDGKQIAFVRVPPFQTPASSEKAAIYLLLSSGGKERKLVDIPGEVYANEYFLPMLAWSPDGKHLAFSCRQDEETPARIMLLGINTLEISALTYPPEGTMGDYAPEFSPDGREIVFISIGSDLWGNQDLWIQSLETALRKQLTNQGYVEISQPVWPAGMNNIYYFSDMGVSMINASGGIPRLVPGLGRSAGELSVLEDKIVYVEKFGTDFEVFRIPGRCGQKQGQHPKRLFSGRWPRISPDGNRITYSSDRTGIFNIWISKSDGSNPVQVTDSRISSGAPSWSPDGTKLAFDSSDYGKGDLFIVPLERGPIQRITSGPAANMAPIWSRDGNWIYFRSTRTGRSEVWKIPVKGDQAEQVTFQGGYSCFESMDGKSLFFTRKKLSGLWRKPVGGGPETKIIEQDFLYLHWAVTETGVYFINFKNIGQLREYYLKYYEFSSGKISLIVSETNLLGSGWIDISRDESWMACARETFPESELILVENFFP
jgi:Tol biopolymer transport system component